MAKNPIREALDALRQRAEAHQAPNGPLPPPPPDQGLWRRGLRAEPHLTCAPSTALSLSEARRAIAQAMNEYCALERPTHMLLVQAPPGVGKTTLAALKAEAVAASGHRVLYAGPRHDFFQDLLRAARHPDWWYEWLPRQRGDEGGRVETCRYAVEMAAWIHRGYEPMEFCSNPKICGWSYVNDGCPYHAQKAIRQPIIYGQHGHVVGGHALMDQIRLVIGDENPINAFLRDWIIPGRHIVPPEMDPTEPITELLHELQQAAARGARADGIDLLRLLGGPQRVLEICEAVHLPAEAVALAPNLRSASAVDDAPYFHLPKLVHLLGREARAHLEGHDCPPRVAIADNKLHLLLRDPPDRRLPPHVIWLDGTAEPRVYETLFQRPVEVVAPQVELRGRIFQVWDRTNGKGTLIREGEATPKAQQLVQQIRHIIRTRAYRRPAIITFQALERLFGDDTPDVTHFYGARGTNRFEECDAVIVAGAPQPHLTEFLKTARMLYQERITPFRTDRSDRHVTFHWTDEEGQSWSYPVSNFWDDPDLQALLWQYREAEIIQAAHRGRPVIRDVDIWLLTNIPIEELPPTELLSVRELFGAPPGVDPYRWLEVLALADRCYDNGEPLGAPDIAAVLGISRKVATHYWEQLRATQPDRWHVELMLVPAKRTGRPRRILRPRRP